MKTNDTMQEEILTHIEDPVYLESLYRKNKSDFKKSFDQIYPNLQGNKLSEFWHERLAYEPDAISWGTKKELVFVAILSLLAGLLAKIPHVFSINEEFFYPRNISFIVLPALTAYFIHKNKLSNKKTVWITATLLFFLIYINLLPNNTESATLTLACIHLPFLLWGLFGISFSGHELQNFQKRLEFLRFNGDLVVMSGLLLIAGGLMTGITLGLFELIGLKIQEFYFRYVVIFGLPMVPIVAAFLTQNNPHLVNKVSPVIAKLFSPLVLVMLLIYLGAIVISGKDPYNDREFLLIFNLLLVGVMALIFFSVAEISTNEKNSFGKLVLLMLSVITIIINGIALSAIHFRISEWGITPNRLAVVGVNIIMLIHLITVTYKLFKSVNKKSGLTEVGKAIVLYLPIYLIWAFVVVFIFPLVFGFN
jgi:hypothetical protein